MLWLKKTDAVGSSCQGRGMDWENVLFEMKKKFLQIRGVKKVIDTERKKRHFSFWKRSFPFLVEVQSGVGAEFDQYLFLVTIFRKIWKGWAPLWIYRKYEIPFIEIKVRGYKLEGEKEVHWDDDEEEKRDYLEVTLRDDVCCQQELVEEYSGFEMGRKIVINSCREILALS
jgi:hypothetical protein